MFPLPANIYFEIAALLTSVIFWGKIKNSRLRWLLPFLFFIVTIELLGRYIRKDLHAPNAWLYNISVPIEYLFYAFLLEPFYKNKFSQTIVKIFLLIFPIWALCNILFVQGFYYFNTNFFKIGSIAMLLFCFLFFSDLLKREELMNPFTQPLFWIACGLFLFNAGEFVSNTFFDAIVTKRKAAEQLFQQINNNLIFVLYSSIIIAIISSLWVPKEKT